MTDQKLAGGYLSNVEYDEHGRPVIGSPIPGSSFGSDLQPLDMHGVDDAGVYHAPSRARYEQMIAREAALEARVTELLASCTATENERRKFAAMHVIARDLLMEILVDVPLANRLSNADPIMAQAIAHDLPAYEAALKRNELLERDVWSGAATLARKFVEGATTALKHPELLNDGWPEAMVRKYRDAFATLLDIEIEP